MDQKRSAFGIVLWFLVFVNISEFPVCTAQNTTPKPSYWIKQRVRRQMTGDLSATLRNGSGSEDFSPETVLFPRILDALLDAGKQWTKYNISKACLTSLREYALSLQNKETWAIRIYDASGKQGPGMLVGGLTQHGNYDECLNARHYRQLQPSRMTSVHVTQYCSAFFDTPPWMARFVETLDIPAPARLPQMTVDLCVPAACRERDLHDVIITHLQTRNENVSLLNVECFHHPDITSDSVALIVIAVFSILLLLVLLGTCMDALDRLRQMEVLSGEVEQVGFQQQRLSRLSRFRASFLSHWQHIMGAGHGHYHNHNHDYKPMQRRATIGGTYSRVSWT